MSALLIAFRWAGTYHRVRRKRPFEPVVRDEAEFNVLEDDEYYDDTGGGAHKAKKKVMLPLAHSRWVTLMEVRSGEAIDGLQGPRSRGREAHL